MFVREKRIECGKEYVEIDLVPRSLIQERTVKGVREKKKIISRPAQVNLNDKNSKRYLTQLANGNFDHHDLMLGLDYNSKYRPGTIKEAEKEVKNYLRRVGYRMKKEGLPDVKYILVTEYSDGKDEEKEINIHHHLIVSGGLDRDIMESLWAKGRGKKKEPMGRCNTRRLQFNENGVEGLSRYMLKDPKGKKRWSSSRNLKRPTLRRNDFRYTQRKLEKYALSNDLGLEIFQKQYPNHFITSIRVYENEYTGYHFYLRLWKKPKSGDIPYHMKQTVLETTSEDDWKDKNLYRRKYGLFKGNELLASGTVREIAESRGVQVSTIFHYGTPGYKNRTNGNGLRLEKI